MLGLILQALGAEGEDVEVAPDEVRGERPAADELKWQGRIENMARERGYLIGDLEARLDHDELDQLALVSVFGISGRSS